MAAGNGNRAPRIQLGADQQGAAPFATRNGLDGVGWLLSEKLVTIHDAVFNGAGVRFADIGNAREVTCQAVRLENPARKNRVDCPFERGG
jgi:hypothetical protein